jgi:predicted DNA-binding protein YlxM (UPF0122 family)
MELDSLAARERQVALYERYGPLLTEHQRQTLDLYLRRDWSLAEVARRRRISRAAVHDAVRRALAALESFEERLGLVAEEKRRRTARAAVSRELRELRRRMSRVEAEVAGI